MKRGILIVMEGACDGIGKSTQYQKLYDELLARNYQVVSHHFPSYNTFQGAPVVTYLAGKFGNIDELSPYFINSLYAIDRACTWYLKLKKDYEEGKIILLDRYTTSSIIYQSSVIEDIDERVKFIDYINYYEYNKFGIPVPYMVIFLDAPFDLVTNLRNNRKDYEGNSNDIHEKNIDFMKKVYNNAEFVADYLNWDRIECSKDNQIRSIDQIHEDITKKVLSKSNLFKNIQNKRR